MIESLEVNVERRRASWHAASFDDVSGKLWMTILIDTVLDDALSFCKLYYQFVMMIFNPLYSDTSHRSKTFDVWSDRSIDQETSDRKRARKNESQRISRREIHRIREVRWIIDKKKLKRTEVRKAKLFKKKRHEDVIATEMTREEWISKYVE